MPSGRLEFVPEDFFLKKVQIFLVCSTKGHRDIATIFLEKDTSLIIINIEYRETKLNVHKGYTRSKRGRGGSMIYQPLDKQISKFLIKL